MSIEEKDVILTPEDIKRIRVILKNTKFEDFKINKYFFRDKFTGRVTDCPRHNMELDDVKKVYEKLGSIEYGFKRKTDNGYTYTICYNESKNVFVKIGFLFDKEPKEIFMGIRIFRKLEGAILKRYGLKI